MSLSLIGRRRYFAFAPDFVPIAARPVVRATQDYTADDEATQVCNFLQNLLKINRMSSRKEALPSLFIVCFNGVCFLAHQLICLVGHTCSCLSLFECACGFILR